MKKLISFVKVTIAGGILFLIPLTVLILVLSKAQGFLRQLSRPIAEKLSFTQFAGLGIAGLISILLLLLLCLLAGIFMQTRIAQNIIKWIEDNVLVLIPGYSYIRAFSTDKLAKEGTSNWKPATIFVDDNEVLCFVIDETENYCSVFLPAAPSPSSGSVCVRNKKIVTFLPLSVSETIIMIRQFGKGLAQVIEEAKPVTQ